MVTSKGVVVHKGFWPWILKLQALQDIWGGLPWGLTLTDLRPGLFLSVREACPARSASGQCGPTCRERPTHTHVLLLPAIVFLCALTDGLPDAGIQAVADHMNQLGWKVDDKQWLTYMFLQQSCLPGRTVITPSNYSIFTESLRTAPQHGRRRAGTRSAGDRVPMLVQAVCSWACW